MSTVRSLCPLKVKSTEKFFLMDYLSSPESKFEAFRKTKKQFKKKTLTQKENKNFLVQILQTHSEL